MPQRRRVVVPLAGSLALLPVPKSPGLVSAGLTVVVGVVVSPGLLCSGGCGLLERGEDLVPVFGGGGGGGSNHMKLSTAARATLGGHTLDTAKQKYHGNRKLTPSHMTPQQKTALKVAHSAIAYIRADQLRPLAVCTIKRFEGPPDIPTVAEFVPGFEASSWFGIAAPKGAPLHPSHH